MKKLLAVLMLLSLGFISCTAQTKSGKKPRISYKLAIEFISKGSGIDNAMFTKIEELAKSNPKVPGYNVVEKGKEGEKVMYFGLSEMTEDEQYAFVNDVRAAVGKSKMVLVISKLKKRKKQTSLQTAPVGTATAQPTNTNTVAATNSGLTGTNATTGNKYKLMVSYISKGSGTDEATFEKIDAFVKGHPKKPIYNLEIKGREGEKNMLFKLDDFSGAEEVAFVNEINKLAEGKDLVIVESAAVKKAPKANGLDIAIAVKYRVIISFISKGAGIDNNAHDKIKNYIDNHSKKPVYEAVSWGREGERDYILTLKELTPDEQKVFVEEVNKLKIKSDRVFIRENEEYTKKGK